VNATRLALWWVDRYTRGVPEAARAGRRAELASDLWEHRAACGGGSRVELAIVSRCVRGMPADLAWRRARRHGGRLPSARTAARLAGRSIGLLAYAFLVGFHGYNATALAGLDLYGADWPPGDVVRYASISAVVLVLLLAGGILLRPFAAAGAGVLGTAALATCVVFWWAAPIFGPAGLAVVAPAVARARRRSQMVSSAAS
jgi:hypothetical protein